jgi:hypothetical protein
MIYSGLGKASLVVCVSQAPYLFDESIHVLKFASIATRITTDEKFREPPRPAATPSSRFSSVLAAGGDGGKSLLMASTGRSSTAWEEEPRSLPPFAGGGRSLPAAFGARMRSTGGGSIPPRVEEGQEEDEQVGQNISQRLCRLNDYIILFCSRYRYVFYCGASEALNLCILRGENPYGTLFRPKKRQLSCSGSLFLPH